MKREEDSVWFCSCEVVVVVVVLKMVPWDKAVESIICSMSGTDVNAVQCHRCWRKGSAGPKRSATASGWKKLVSGDRCISVWVTLKLVQLTARTFPASARHPNSLPLSAPNSSLLFRRTAGARPPRVTSHLFNKPHCGVGSARVYASRNLK